MNSPGFADQLRETVGRALKSQANERLPDENSPSVDPAGRTICPWSRWPAQMDYTANIILQKADRCQVDHSAILVFYEMVEFLSKQEALCAKMGLFQRSSNLCDQLNVGADSSARKDALGSIAKSVLRLRGAAGATKEESLRAVRANSTRIGDAMAELASENEKPRTLTMGTLAPLQQAAQNGTFDDAELFSEQSFQSNLEQTDSFGSTLASVSDAQSAFDGMNSLILRNETLQSISDTSFPVVNATSQAPDAVLSRMENAAESKWAPSELPSVSGAPQRLQVLAGNQPQTISFDQM